MNDTVKIANDCFTALLYHKTPLNRNELNNANNIKAYVMFCLIATKHVIDIIINGKILFVYSIDKSDDMITNNQIKVLSLAVLLILLGCTDCNCFAFSTVC